MNFPSYNRAEYIPHGVEDTSSCTKDLKTISTGCPLRILAAIMTDLNDQVPVFY
jgi:hypothetical protein